MTVDGFVFYMQELLGALDHLSTSKQHSIGSPLVPLVILSSQIFPTRKQSDNGSRYRLIPYYLLFFCDPFQRQNKQHVIAFGAYMHSKGTHTLYLTIYKSLLRVNLAYAFQNFSLYFIVFIQKMYLGQLSNTVREIVGLLI